MRKITKDLFARHYDNCQKQPANIISCQKLLNFFKYPHIKLDDFAQEIEILLASTYKLNPLLKTLEAKFTEFLEIYQPNPLEDYQLQFNQWYFDDLKGIPSTLPIPTTHDLEFARKTKAYDALILFFYQELLSLDYLNNPIEEALIYCATYANPRDLNEKLRQGKLFVDSGLISVTAHGKYTHLLQLILIGYAQQSSLITNKIKWRNLVNMLVEKKYLNGKPYFLWNQLLDYIPGRHTYGSDPFSLNITMLLNRKDLWPTLHQYWGLSYIKHLVKQAFYFQQENDKGFVDNNEECKNQSIDDQSADIDLYLSGHLRNIGQLMRYKNSEKDWKKNKDVHPVGHTKAYNGMFYKTPQPKTSSIAKHIWDKHNGIITTQPISLKW
jgi:hypothetical protein